MAKGKKTKKDARKMIRTTNYPVADFLARVKNAALAYRKTVNMADIKLVKEVAEAMVKLGYLDGVEQIDGQLVAKLTYKFKKPMLIDARIVSKPGLRVYMGVDEIEAQRSPSTLIISTPKGVMTSKEAIKNRAGGEVLAEIF